MGGGRWDLGLPPTSPTSAPSATFRSIIGRLLAFLFSYLILVAQQEGRAGDWEAAPGSWEGERERETETERERERLIKGDSRREASNSRAPPRTNLRWSLDLP